jgi:hypothetical protein
METDRNTGEGAHASALGGAATPEVATRDLSAARGCSAAERRDFLI